MKLRLCFLGLALGLCIPSWAQEGVDVTQLTADPKTFIFSNNKNTVKAYINSEFETKTTCCGNDRIYLEVKIDPNGHVLSAKTLTGKNDCYKQSAIDIIRNVKWDTKDFKGAKSIYFEIKPGVDCKDGRDNTYAQVKIFNNPFWDENGNKVSGGTRPVAVATPPATQPEPRPATPQPTVTPEPTPAATQPAASEPVATTPQPAPTRSQPEPTPSTPQPVVSAEPTPTPPDDGSNMLQPTTAAAEPAPLTQDEKDAIAQEEQEKERISAEITSLREQMARMRAQEEVTFQRELEAKKAQQQTTRAVAQNNEPEPDWGSEGNGGLFLDDQDYEGNDKPFEGDKKKKNQGEQVAQSEEERIRQRIQDLQRRQDDIRRQSEDRERQRQQAIADAERDNQEILNLEQERLQMESELANTQEEKELQGMQEMVQQTEDVRRTGENEYQRILDEINRLKEEAAIKIADLERAKDDMERAMADKQRREQEIMLIRTQRGLDNERRLEELRISMAQSTGGAPINVASSSTGLTPVSGNDLLQSLMPQLETKADSEKLKMLIEQMELLRREIEFLRSQGGGGNTSITSPGGTPRSAPATVNNKPTVPGGRNAATDKSYKNVNIYQPGVDKSIYKSNKYTPPPAEKQTGHKPGKGYSPDASHADTHANSKGPQFSPRYYIDGEDAMKNVITDRLQKGGVCGLSHAVFAVTLNPDGSVASHQVLSANSIQVQAQMDMIIPSLQFNPIEARYRQTIYQEVKGEIVCGDEATINLREVPSLIKE
ncbi:MAG: hypothetical protein AAFR61_15775 [Bacteroidota bacterium]